MKITADPGRYPITHHWYNHHYINIKVSTDPSIYSNKPRTNATEDASRHLFDVSSYFFSRSTDVAADLDSCRPQWSSQGEITENSHSTTSPTTVCPCHHCNKVVQEESTSASCSCLQYMLQRFTAAKDTAAICTNHQLCCQLYCTSNLDSNRKGAWGATNFWQKSAVLEPFVRFNVQSRMFVQETFDLKHLDIQSSQKLNWIEVSGQQFQSCWHIFHRKTRWFCAKHVCFWGCLSHLTASADNSRNSRIMSHKTLILSLLVTMCPYAYGTFRR